MRTFAITCCAAALVFGVSVSAAYAQGGAAGRGGPGRGHGPHGMMGGPGARGRGCGMGFCRQFPGQAVGHQNRAENSPAAMGMLNAEHAQVAELLANHAAITRKVVRNSRWSPDHNDDKGSGAGQGSEKSRSADGKPRRRGPTSPNVGSNLPGNLLPPRRDQDRRQRY